MSRSLYEHVLKMGLEVPKPKVRASGGVVLWRKKAGRREVYWVERSKKLAFMGGFHAFPGGGRSRADVHLRVAGVPSGLENAPLAAGLPASVLEGVELEPIVAPGVLACVLRELFEEAGLLLGGGAEALETRQVQGARRASLEKGANFAEIIAGLGIELDASELEYAGRWLTPPLGPVRFDNRFFLLEWPSGRPTQPSVVEGELVAGEWVDPRRAIERWRRGKVITAPPILHILEVLAEEGSIVDLPRLQAPVEANLGPFRRIEFRPGVLMFPLPTPTLPPAAYTNAYVLGTREALLVDPGSPFPGVIDGLIEALRELEEREGRRVTAIWLTHHHPDHIGGVERISNALGVPVAAHKLTADRLAADGIRVERELAEGDQILLEGEPSMSIRVFHTPGHARGHLAFYDESGGSLLGGDLTAGFGTIVIDPPEGDMDQYLVSLERMRGLGANTLFPAHGPPTVSVSEKFEEYITHRHWREQKILDAWREGSRGGELVASAYDDVPVEAHPLAARQLEAHLERLRSLGLVSTST